MWNQFLDQAKSQRKFHNTPVLVLGQKHSGKRSLVDSLFDVSKTTLYSKKLSSNYTTGKMKLKGLAPILDYSYLNVVDLSDPDYRTHAKLQIYMVEDPHNRQVYKQLQNPQILKKAVVLIMLDFTTPWDFMEQLNSWVLFLQQLQIKAGLSIVQLQAMAKKMESDYKKFREAEFDENGQLKKNFQENQQQIDIPLIQGVLQNNLRMPIVVCINKCDLQSSVLRDQSANKLQFVLYHLRKFCIRYGGSLIYTSIKNNSNLSILYQYILHRSYSMSLRYKPQIINQEAIFVPFGYDNPTLLQDSLLKMDVSSSYNQVISPPVNKKVTKEQIMVEQDSEYFKKYMGISSSSVSTSISTINQSTSNNDQSSIISKPKGNAKKFFQDLLKSNNATGQSQEEKKTSKAQNSLLKNINKQMNLSKQIKAKE